MPDRPPPLDNGYVWITHTIMPAAKSRLLEQRLGGIRHELRARDHRELGDLRHDTEVELWAHSEEESRAASIMLGLLGDA